MHKRKSSKEDDHSQLALASPPSPPSTNGNTNGSMNSVDGHRPNPAPRTRTISTPVGLSLVVQPPSTTTPTFPNAFPLPSPTSGRGPPSTLRPGHRAPSSPLHASFSMPGHKPGQAGHGHGRNSSMSASSSFYSPPSPSPLSSSFPSSSNSFGPARPPPHSHSRSGSYAGPPTTSFPPPESGPHPPSPTGTIPSSSSSASVPSTSTTTASRRHHARLHSRNLSVFFPRPGQQQQPTITEDDAPDTESNQPYPTPVSPIPPASPSPRLGEGFTFGARPPPDALDSSSSSGLADDVNGGATARKSRRGHHHKHSMSHNFFSFLEPGSQPHAHGRKPSVSANGQQGGTWDPDTAPQDLHAHAHRAPSPSLSPAPLSASLSTSSRSTSTAPFAYAGANDRIPPAAALASLATFALGAWMWVVGQQVGSLACTGLGYWIVFDALGVGVGRILPVWLRRPGMVSPLGRPYGNARVESVALFAQGVYLMFSAVYVFKETVEHLLLSAGEGHHHHPGDEDVELLGIEFPLHLLFFAFMGLCANSFLFDNNARLVSITGIRLPPLSTLLDPSGSRLRYATTQRPEPSTPLGRLAENPFSAVAVALALVIAGVSVLVPATEHRACDLVLAAVEAVSMGMLAYPLCVAIGTVLLQTAPARGTASGRTEAFLRAMREIERHKDVQHLPPPHVWQLTPHEHSPNAPQQPLVVALELRVSRDLDDARVLALARWAAGRCGSSLGLSEREAEEWVTVGITRG